MEYSSLSLKEIIELVQTRQVSSEELVKYYFARIKKFAGKNAVLEVFEDALEIAREKDEYAKSHKQLPILHGIPILLKDNIAYKGHKLSCSFCPVPRIPALGGIFRRCRQYGGAVDAP